MRLFLIYYITAQQVTSESDLEQYRKALLDTGCDLSPLNYIKQWKAFTKMASTPANYSNSGVKPLGLFSRVMNTGSQFVMEGVKNLVLKQHVSTAFSGAFKVLTNWPKINISLLILTSCKYY
ncbi:Sec1 domain containing protein 1 [Ameca splendens]|uniref:Sec1 domain containing protein 1 n=1 Tax=Ameca splendens TaxID=208324 RepID=A0ABV0XVX8_9TELE